MRAASAIFKSTFVSKVNMVEFGCGSFTTALTRTMSALLTTNCAIAGIATRKLERG